MTSEPFVLRRDAGGVRVLTLNRPAQFNALSSGMLAALQAELDATEHDPAVRVVVLAAAGKAFCAGHDLKEMQSHGEDKAFFDGLFGQCSRMMLTIQRMPQPVIAKVQGIATAAGCQLVAQCDLAIASDDARFATSGIRYGLFCSTPSVSVSRNLGRKAAFEMLITGEFVDAHTAVREGLINRAVPAGQLDDEVDRLCASILSKPREAVRVGKTLFYKQLELGIAPAYALAGETMACNMLDADAQEGVTAFAQKREPRFGAANA